MAAPHAPSDWWPRAVRRPVRFSTEGGPFSSRPLGWILHVAVMDGSVFRTFDGSTHPNRKSAHLWVAKDGTVEQYVPLSSVAWHAMAGNASYWGVETEGFPEDPLTDAQLDTLAAWHAWSGTSDTVCTAPGQSGISAHYLGGSAWGRHSCPDPSPGGQGPRSHQRGEIIARANGATTMAHDPLDANDLAALAKAEEGYFTSTTPDGRQVTEHPALTLVMASLARIEAALAKGATVSLTQAQVDAVAAAVAAHLPPGHLLTPADVQAIAAATCDLLVVRLKS